MDREAAIQPSPDDSTPHLTSTVPATTTATAASPFSETCKVDEGYSDETKSPSDHGLSSSSNDAMALSDWMFAQGEHDRAGVFRYLSPCLSFNMRVRFADEFDLLL